MNFAHNLVNGINELRSVLISQFIDENNAVDIERTSNGACRIDRVYRTGEDKCSCMFISTSNSVIYYERKNDKNKDK